MGANQSLEGNREKFQFIDYNDAQEFHFKPTNQDTSLQSIQKPGSTQQHGPVDGEVGEHTGLSQFIIPLKYAKFMQQHPLLCENPQIKSFSGFAPYMFKKSLNVYHGEWKQGKPHGYGKIFNPDLDYYYEGYFQQGLPSYYGVYVENQISYRGQFKLGRAEGKGVYKQNKTLIQGEFQQNLPYKNCIQKGEDYEFHGDYDNNGKWKKGKIIWDQGKSSYEGDFLNGLIHGNGLLMTQSYSYHGDFKTGKRHGFGKLYWNGGYTYNGNFVEDQINGYGELYLKNKLIYKGEFENGKAKGEGCVVESQKLIYAYWNDGQASQIS